MLIVTLGILAACVLWLLVVAGREDNRIRQVEDRAAREGRVLTNHRLPLL